MEDDWATELYEPDDEHPTAAEIADAVATAADERARHLRESQAQPFLVPYEVGWLHVAPEVPERFREVLEGAKDERPLQRFFEEHPQPLVVPLGGGHGRWAIPQQRLGSEFVPDFVIAEKSSVGFEWVAIELESPRARMFTTRGDPSRQLNHAIRQVSEWRTWLKNNRPYAVAPPNQHGLGLVDIDVNVPGWIIIGRRADEDESHTELRRELGQRLNIKVRSYDWLLERTEARADGRW
jgi:hypothetical protein